MRRSPVLRLPVSWLPVSWLPVLLLPALLTACGPEGESSGRLEPAGPPVIQCVNYPLAYFASRFAQGDVTVRLETPAGLDPAFWQPTGDQVRAYQRAVLILANGAGYAKWMRTASLPTSRIVDTSRSFTDRLIQTGGGVTHSHGPEGDHTHGAVAFTTWLDFRQALAQARAVGEAMVARDLISAARFTAAFSGLEADLLQLDTSMREIGAARGRAPLLASHPVYAYLARAYDLNLKSEHFEPDALPSSEAFAILASLRKSYPADWMLWEGRPIPESVQKLEALGVGSVVFDPCANRPPEGDFLSVMQANVARLRQAIAP